MNKKPLPVHLVQRIGRLVKKSIPRPVRKVLKERVFYAVFHMTRITNDAYGWRPPEEQEQ